MARADSAVTVSIEVSVLSPLMQLAASSEEALVRALRPGIDGLTLEYRGGRGTFLPQVWQQLPEPLEFLSQLKRKVGLEPGFWSADLRFSRYTVEKYADAPATQTLL